VRRLAALAACAALLCGGWAEPAPSPQAEAAVAVHDLDQDARVAGLLDQLGGKGVRGQILFRDVNLVDPAAGTTTEHQSVVTWGSSVFWTGPFGQEPKLEPNAVVIEGRGRFLAPGLTDMHVHSERPADYLLDLATGVTTVREMDGFPWMLRMRDAVSARRVLGPTFYVAGTILNQAPLDGYAVLVRDGAEAWRVVRQQAACGYDFIKVHNNLSESVFDATAEAARSQGLDLVGHVPHEMSVRHAATHGMRTMEHLKGFLDDRTLTPGDTDFAAVTDGPEVWNTPTLYTIVRDSLRGDAARALIARPESRYVSWAKRQGWTRTAGEAPDKVQQGAAGYARAIMAELTRRHARFLAGTDAAGYNYEVMGYALIDEVGLLQDAGLSPAQALAAATVEPARAMRLDAAFGQIRPRMRADLVLLDADPLKDAAALRRNLGIMAHGVWLERAALDEALKGLAAIYAEPDPSALDGAAAMVSALQAQAAKGFAFNSMKLAEAAKKLRGVGMAEPATALDRLADIPAGPPCAAWTP
jgi:cytosine/adenosine deaminase-related metal-dependent hydrolase